jgi:uncharacterized protein (TIGR02453 family)
MRSRFPGFPPEALQFFRSLARHNHRDWFQPRKPVFEAQVKQPMRALVEALNGAMKTFAPDYVTDPDKAIYRIYRDTRFSKDKTPYKDHIAASFRRRGAGPHQEGGYYLQLSHKEVAVGGGVYMPQPPVLLGIRQHIAPFASCWESCRATNCRACRRASRPPTPRPTCCAARAYSYTSISHPSWPPPRNSSTTC